MNSLVQHLKETGKVICRRKWIIGDDTSLMSMKSISASKTSLCSGIFGIDAKIYNR